MDTIGTERNSAGAFFSEQATNNHSEKEELSKRVEMLENEIEEKEECIRNLQAQLEHSRQSSTLPLPSVSSLGFESGYFYALGWSLLYTVNRGMPEKDIVDWLQALAEMRGRTDHIPSLNELKQLHPIFKPDVFRLDGAPTFNNTVAMVLCFYAKMNKLSFQDNLTSTILLISRSTSFFTH